MPNVNRVKRSLYRAGELQECLTPTCSQGFEVPAVEIVGPVDGTRDGFDSGSEGPEGVNAAGKNRPLELNPAGRQLTNTRVEQAAQAQAAEIESRRYAELAEQSFSLTGRRDLRA